MTDLHRDLGARVQELRTAIGLTQQQVGERVGLTRQSITNIEGGRHVPRGSVLVALAEALGTTVAGLVGSAPETVRMNRAEARITALEDQVRRLVGVLNTAGTALGAFDLVVRESGRSKS